MLTGPAAAALYGNAAASGVVLINTKKGTKDKTNISVSSSTTFSNPTMLPKMQNKYGNKDGVFASWGDVVNSNYDPEKFFRTGVNTINSVSLSTGTSKNQTYVSVRQLTRQVFFRTTSTNATTYRDAIPLLS